MKLNIILLLLVFLSGGFAFSQNSLSLPVRINSFSMKTDSGNLIITPWSQNIIRISLAEKGESNTTDAVIMKPSEVNFSKIESGSLIILKTDSVKIVIDRRNLRINYFDSDNQLIASHEGFVERTDTTGFIFKLKKDEMIFGGGEGAIPTNRRGYRLNLNNEPHWGYSWGEVNLNYSVPHFISSENYSVYYDNGAIGHADIGRKDSTIMEIASCSRDKSYFFIYSSTQKGLLKYFTQLTGTQPMPPRWAMGNMMSRFGYKTEKETKEKVDSMLNAGYPVDAVIIDLYWFGLGPDGWKMGDLDWYTPNWPTPVKMISDLKTKGVQTVLITEPYVLETSVNFKEADEKGYFAKDINGKTNIVEDFWFGPAGLIDLFNEDACSWYWKFYKKQVEIGVAGWWGDLGEPEKFHNDLIFTAGEGPLVRNLYGHYWSKMLSDKYNSDYPDKRLFHLNRAGFAGSQRYSSYPWSGDVSRTWGGFKAQLPNMLSMSLSNIPYAHSDLGGFCAEPKNEELYLRWLQFGVFNPVFRPHSEKVPSEPIFYSDSLQKLVKPFFELRYQLLPYNYTLAWKQEISGEPLASPLFLKSALPKSMWGIYDEYFWGDAFLVAPVLDEKQKEKEIFLPAGIWFDFFTEMRHLGSSFLIKKLDYKTIPVFVKAGSFVPMTSKMVNTSFYDPSAVDIHFYYDATVEKSEYKLYNDDGETRSAYFKNLFETVDFYYEVSGGDMKFNIINQGFDYKGRPESRKINLIIHNFPEGYGDGVVISENKTTSFNISLKKNKSVNLVISKNK
ncbi:MAG: DUF4968 domain-containing protein [Prolixibacteraceae bacterium]|nr:DUF4968 domain-containing protein [Prolixibacteraceae bacterium]